MVVSTPDLFIHNP